ncbi:hypothetical protein Gotri_006044, partial [Gossypium trilobum]|nr:hypothetical protein [Gossypium trilobum]
MSNGGADHEEEQEKNDNHKNDVVSKPIRSKRARISQWSASYVVGRRLSRAIQARCYQKGEEAKPKDERLSKLGSMITTPAKRNSRQ